MEKKTIVLHGMWFAVEREEYLEIHFPKMSDHLYIAGPWLAETQLPAKMDWDFRGYFGPQNGAARFPKDGPAPLVNCGHAALPARVLAGIRYIKLPYPDKLLALTRVEAADEDPYIVKTNTQEYRSAGACFGLQFEVNGTGPLPWEEDDRGTEFPDVLHIYATSSSRFVETSARHHQAEAAATNRFFPEAGISFFDGDTLAPTFVDGAAEELGLTPWETLTLIERQGRLSVSGDSIRSKLVGDHPPQPVPIAHEFDIDGGQGGSAVECLPAGGEG
jgi:hypothetical protein